MNVNSEVGCHCHRCRDAKIEQMDFSGKSPFEQIEQLGQVNGFTMILCPTCGNKRCPHASDHRLSCSGSNEAGQAGSVYQ